MIIFDEKKYVEDNMLDDSYCLAGNRLKTELIMFGRYLKYKGCEDSVIIPALQKKAKGTMLEYNVANQDFIDDLLIKISQREIYHDRVIEITETELYKIKKINHNQTERVMFAFMVIQKFFGSKYIKTNVNELQVMCKLNYNANYFKENILKKLSDMGYINIYATNLYKINIITNESFTAIKVVEFDDVIRYYLDTCNTSEYIYCNACGKKTRRKSNRQKYCDECSERINKEKTLQNRKKV